jgi:hypothetical protein
MPIGNMRGGNVWINHAVFVAIDTREFHPIILAFASKRIEWGLPQRPPTLFVFALHASFVIEKPHRSDVLTEMRFRSTVPKYLHLEIGKQVHGDNFETVLRDGEKC